MSKKEQQTEKELPRLRRVFLEQVKSLQKELGYKNPMQVPSLTKIVVNVGQGDAAGNIKIMEAAVKDMEAITGQKAIMTRAKKAIAGFKIRKGIPIGCAVTLRKDRMYEFLDRFINVAVPRIRDFRGFSPKSFDGRGNYSLGIKEQLIFPEIDYDKVDKIRGVSITFCSNAKTDTDARALLNVFNFPFRKN